MQNHQSKLGRDERLLQAFASNTSIVSLNLSRFDFQVGFMISEMRLTMVDPLV
jgi:hypothetical protein